MRTLTLYTRACGSCGKARLELKKLHKLTTLDVEVLTKQTRYNPAAAQEHAQALASLGVDITVMQSVVVGSRGAVLLKDITADKLDNIL